MKTECTKVNSSALTVVGIPSLSTLSSYGTLYHYTGIINNSNPKFSGTLFSNIYMTINVAVVVFCFVVSAVVRSYYDVVLQIVGFLLCVFYFLLVLKLVRLIPCRLCLLCMPSHCGKLIA